MTVMAANVQRFVQDRTVPSAVRSSRRMAPDEVMPISRRAIAVATGLPRETVRRQVQEMLDAGYLLARPDGILVNLLIQDQRAVTGITAVADVTATLAQQLVQVGVLRVSRS
jgi:DNA-binding IclR family transcriptional regulator